MQLHPAENLGPRFPGVCVRSLVLVMLNVMKHLSSVEKRNSFLHFIPFRMTLMGNQYLPKHPLRTAPQRRVYKLLSSPRTRGTRFFPICRSRWFPASAGLVIAIPLVLVYFILRVRLERLLAHLEVVAADLSDLITKAVARKTDGTGDDHELP